MFRCDSKITNIIRVPDKSKLFECEFPDCFKFFDSYEKLGMHKYSIHNLQVESSIIFKYNSMMMQNSSNNNNNNLNNNSNPYKNNQISMNMN